MMGFNVLPDIILGPPGTGKTHRCIDIVNDEIEAGTPPRRIAFCSFTNKAATEAATRAMEKFNFQERDLPYFRTIHSLAFRQLGLRSRDVMQSSDYKVIGDMLGIKFAWRRFDEEGVPSEKYLGDRYSFLDGLSKARLMSPEEVWSEIADEELNWFEFRRFRKTVSEYKERNHKVDFNDMLSGSFNPLEVDVVIIDEAQDLSALQWQWVYRAFPNAQRIYVAGDDDQAIFSWSGAAVDHFVDLPGNRIILDQSRRVPKKVHKMAEAITRQIKHRVPKTYHPREEEGAIEWHSNLDGIEFGPGSWLMLARNSFHLSNMVARVREAGIPYMYRGESAVNPRHIRAIHAWEKCRKGLALSIQESEAIREFRPSNSASNAIWHEALTKIPLEDREYYISLLRRGESLTKTPRIHINTIHGVKGGEADNVVLGTDITSRTREGMEHDPDSEHRVFYVGVTRTRHSLHLIAPTTRSYYEI